MACCGCLAGAVVEHVTNVQRRWRMGAKLLGIGAISQLA
jgi:hypothetical protein